MASRKITRNAATPKGFLRRVLDAQLEEVTDPRRQAWVRHPLVAVLRLAVLSLATSARSTRAVENRSEQLRPQVRAQIGLEQRISDNAFGLLLPQVDWMELRRSLHRQVKAEWRRKNLRPSDQHKSTVAIDGKNLASVPEKHLRALISRRTDLDGDELSVEELRRVLRTQFPYVQLQAHEEGPVTGLVRAHRATLISSDAAALIDQWPIRGETNEEKTIKATLSALFRAYGRTRIIERVTLDAGNATKDVAEMLDERDVDYLMALKGPQGALHRLAVDRLGSRPGHQAAFRTSVEERGKTIYYTVWTCQLDEEHGWNGARQLIHVERVAASEEETTEGHRYFVSSEDPEQLDAQAALELVRSHWRCENEGHWTADAIWDEDARRTPWTMHPDGVLVVGLLRGMAINILAVLRAMSWLERGDDWVTPTWKTVIEQALLILCRPLLEMADFNALDG